MNFSIDSLNFHLNFTSFNEPNSLRRGIGRTFSNIFTFYAYLPLILFHLILKIKNFTQAYFSAPPLFTSYSPPNPTLPLAILPESSSPHLTRLFQQTLADHAEPTKEGQKDNFIDSKTSLLGIDSSHFASNEEQSFDDFKLEQFFSSFAIDELKDKEITELTTEEVVVEINREIEENLPSTTFNPLAIPPAAITRVEPTIINVPDDGNCLLYAIAIGLRKKYINEIEIQKKLQWDIQVEQLSEDLSHASNLLKVPGSKLREQAAQYLENHQFEETIMLALLEGIGSHIEAARKKIEEEEAIIPILMLDIEELESQPQTSSVKEELAAKREHLKAVQDSIEFQKAHMPDEENFGSYIEITKGDHVYCGVAQIFALSKEYHIPIRVLYNYGKPNQYEQTFNQEANKERQHPLPILTLAHLNGNHFQFFND